MEDPDASTWAPQSPDLSAYHNSNDSNNSTNSTAEPHFVHPAQQHTPYRASAYIPGPPPFTPPSSSPIVYGKAAPMPRGKRAGPAAQDPDYLPDAGDASDKAMGKMPEASNGGASDAVDTSGIVIKNHFPVARIKRIMQADDDVGKVAQVTPVVVSKALELFMISLVTKAAAEAKARNSKRVAPAHLKQVVTGNEQFDFLSEIVAKVPDPPAVNAGKSEEGMDVDANGKKRKGSGRTRKKKVEDDDF